MDLVNSYLIISCCCFTAALGITTTHHDKPDESSITNMATMMTTKPELANITLTSAERAKRLLPYESFYQVQPFNRPRYQQRPAEKPRNYQEHDQYQPGRVRFTPFLESNAIPGAFTPMVHPPPQSPRLPDFSVIYDDLARFKLEQNNRRPGYDGVRYFKTIQPTKTTIETFTATNIDIPSEGEKPYVLEIPQGKKPYPQSSFVIVPATDSQKDARRPLLVLQRKPSFKVPSNQARPTYRYKEPTFYHRGPLPKHEDFQKIQPASEYEHFQNKIVPLSNFLHTSNYEEFQKIQSAPRYETFQKPPPKSSLPSPHYEVELEKIPPSQEYQTPPTYEEFRKPPPKSSLPSPHYEVELEKIPTSKEYQTPPTYEEFRNPPPKSSLPSPHYEVELEKIPPSQEYQTPPTYEEFRKPPPKSSLPSPHYEVELEKIPSSPEYQTPTTYEEFQKLPPKNALPYEVDLQKIPPNNFLPSYASPTTSTQDSVPLGDLLKHLQATNTLPKTLTADNIDNSIKTLVRILEALKKRQRITKPIVVQESSSDYEEEDDVDNEAGVGISGYPGELPGTQSFPLDTEEGGTPGKPGVDYPALSSIPQTNFNCKTQRYKGFFGDPDTNCQVWHYCDLNGGQASFLCPNGTIFSQVALTCDWWFNVKCATTPQLYVLNERLYKYIIPLSPKFPEDYSGPLVDKYLALKFQEMEEKMRKEKKGKGNSMKPEEQAEEDVSGEAMEKITMSESSTSSSQKETLQTIEDYNNSK